MAKSEFEKPSVQEFAQILARRVNPNHCVRRTPVTCPETIRALEEMKKHNNDVQFTLEHEGVIYKFLRGTWENEYRTDTNYAVTSERKTYRIGPDANLHIQHLMDGRGGLWLGKPHKGQVQISHVYNTLFPETAPITRAIGLKKKKHTPRVPRFQSAKMAQKAQKKARKVAKATMKSDGVPSSVLTERRAVRISMQKAIISDIEYNNRAREAMMARMMGAASDPLDKALKTAKASRKKSKGNK